MRCTTTLEMIADDLEDEDKWQEEQKRLREEKEGQ